MCSMVAIKHAALRRVAESASKTSPRDLEQRLAQHFHISPRAVRAAVKELVAAGQLAYTNEFGHSFLEISFQRPVRVTPRIFLAPPEFEDPLTAGSIQIRIMPGAAFGCGRHPSTRLALRAIEQALIAGAWSPRNSESVVLDIGTGSGVLMIAAVKLGIQRGIGIDIDPLARAEATQNVRLNRLAQVVHISDGPLEKIAAGRCFAMIIANLRTPTLMRLGARISAALVPGGRVVLAGIRSEELPDLLTVYSQQGLRPLWQTLEKGWTAVVLGPASPELKAASSQ
jgi:ribosomal protein L11 methyltransferase